MCKQFSTPGETFKKKKKEDIIVNGRHHIDLLGIASIQTSVTLILRTGQKCA